jgi:hypothetical protein
MARRSRKGRRRNRHNQDVQELAGTSVITEPKTGAYGGSMALWVCAPFGILMPALRPPHTYDRT